MNFYLLKKKKEMHIFMGVMCSRNLGWFGKVLRSVLGFEKSFGKNEN
jgi:hypothetical protein